MTITSREERLERSPGPSLSGDSDHINYAKVGLKKNSDKLIYN